MIKSLALAVQLSLTSRHGTDGARMNERGDLFHGGMHCLHKKWNKSWNVYWQKKFINKIFFCAITKNSNLEIWTKNLVTFKDENQGWKTLILLGFTEKCNF